MLDRESTFAQPEIVDLLKSRFVPVAIDQAYQRRQKDTEGQFYRQIAEQSPRNDFSNTTQGFYAADATGKLLFYNNNRDPQKLLRLVIKSLADFEQSPPVDPQIITAETIDQRWQVTPPEGGLVVRVRARIVEGYEPTANRWKKIFQNALSRDNLWITKAEHEQLVGGEFPESLQKRIARFHLVDNTRGEPPMWSEAEIRHLEFQLDASGAIEGQANLETRSGDRGYVAELQGNLSTENGVVTRFEMVSLGQFWGEGRFTRGAPEGEFTLAIAFTLADGSDMADRIPPQGSRGWVEGYLR